MAAKIACIAGEEIYRQWKAGHVSGKKLGQRETPFGRSGEIFEVDADGGSFLLMSRYAEGLGKTSPHKINDRANIYALKDIGVGCVLSWGPGGAITHNIAVGDLVILSDLIDQTYLRARTFFEDSPLGFIREFPVFCPTLRCVVGEVLHSMKLVYHGGGIAAVREGPRLETPAEVRMLGTIGAEIVTHSFVPEVFLARELEMCYAAVCYVVNYAEMGSRHRPFAPGGLFGGLTNQNESDRIAGTVGAMSQIVRNVVEAMGAAEKKCDCDKTMAAVVKEYNISPDWRKWFS